MPMGEGRCEFLDHQRLRYFAQMRKNILDRPQGVFDRLPCGHRTADLTAIMVALDHPLTSRGVRLALETHKTWSRVMRSITESRSKQSGLKAPSAGVRPSPRQVPYRGPQRRSVLLLSLLLARWVTMTCQSAESSLASCMTSRSVRFSLMTRQVCTIVGCCKGRWRN
jgi:hypothetical protein